MIRALFQVEWGVFSGSRPLFDDTITQGVFCRYLPENHIPWNSFVRPPVDIMRHRLNYFVKVQVQRLSLVTDIVTSSVNSPFSPSLGRELASLLLMGESNHAHGFWTAYPYWWPCILNFSKMTWISIRFHSILQGFTEHSTDHSFVCRYWLRKEYKVRCCLRAFIPVGGEAGGRGAIEPSAGQIRAACSSALEELPFQWADTSKRNMIIIKRAP